MLSRQAEKETPFRFRIPTRFCIFPVGVLFRGRAWPDYALNRFTNNREFVAMTIEFPLEFLC